MKLTIGPRKWKGTRTILRMSRKVARIEATRLNVVILAILVGMTGKGGGGRRRRARRTIVTTPTGS
jgi:hypothetical protein